MRKRVLNYSTTPQSLFEIDGRDESVGQYRLQDVFVSFTLGGFVTFVMLFLGMRVLRSNKEQSYASMNIAVE